VRLQIARILALGAAALVTIDPRNALAAPRGVAPVISRPYDGPTSAPEPADASTTTRAPPRATPPPPRSATALRSRPEVEPRSPVRVRPVLDLTLTIGAAAPTLGLGLWVEPGLPDARPRPGTTPEVARIDRIALGRYEPAPDVASDVLLAAAVIGPVVYHAIEAGVRRRGWSPLRGRGFLVRWGTDLLILAQTAAINALLTEVLKAAIHRPRPYAYLTPEDVDPSLRDELMADQTATSADWSFPSGHTSAAFAVTTAGATLLTLEMLGRSRWAIALAWIGGVGVSSSVAVLRVAAGRHFPSDVITSALLGSAIGATVPLAHWRPTPAGDVARRFDRRRRWALLPSANRHFAGVTLVVRRR
jgi:membrane-associated phospholipid phosphatase